jgi:nitrite reductase/ring-hydroxylating ferredoxin subunit
MIKFFAAGSIHDLKPGKGRKIRIQKKTIALFKYKDGVYAIQNPCPHQNADLADGYIKEGQVYCSLHHWAFDLSSGAYAFNPKLALQTFEVKIEKDIIYIGIETE